MLNLEPNLTDDVLPISAATSQLARRISQTQRTGRPIVVTQKGAPACVIISVDTFIALRALLAAHQEGAPTPEPEE